MDSSITHASSNLNELMQGILDICKGIRNVCVMYQPFDIPVYDHDHTCRVALDKSRTEINVAYTCLANTFFG